MQTTIRSWGRGIERRLIRPLFTRLRMATARGIGSPKQGRIALLERRVDELERLFREQAGLQYLRIAGGPSDATQQDQHDAA